MSYFITMFIFLNLNKRWYLISFLIILFFTSSFIFLYFFERDLFLDDVSVEELERQLGVTVKITEPDGYSFICSLAE